MSESEELFIFPPLSHNATRCGKCRYWTKAETYYGYGYGVCTFFRDNRNQFGFKKRSKRSFVCDNFKPIEVKK